MSKLTSALTSKLTIKLSTSSAHQNPSLLKLTNFLAPKNKESEKEQLEKEKVMQNKKAYFSQVNSPVY